jgi:hypothetical protein
MVQQQRAAHNSSERRERTNEALRTGTQFGPYVYRQRAERAQRAQERAHNTQQYWRRYIETQVWSEAAMHAHHDRSCGLKVSKLGALELPGLGV